MDAQKSDLARMYDEKIILEKRIAELEYQLANHKASADGTTHWCAECKMREDRIAELEKSIENHLNASKIAFEALQSWDANIAQSYAVILLLNQSPEPLREEE